MPHYEFFCHACKKSFSKVLSLVDYEEGDVLCPHSGSKEVEQCWSAFSRHHLQEERVKGSGPFDSFPKDVPTGKS